MAKPKKNLFTENIIDVLQKISIDNQKIKDLILEYLISVKDNLVFLIIEIRYLKLNGDENEILLKNIAYTEKTEKIKAKFFDYYKDNSVGFYSIQKVLNFEYSINDIEIAIKYIHNEKA